MRVGKWVTAALVVALVFSTAAMGATEEAKQAAIDKGLSYLASTQSGGAWYNNNNGTVAATASAALAFIEEGYTPGDGSAYDGNISGAVNYVLSRASTQGGGVYFYPGNQSRNVYTTGVVAPMIYALGEALGPDTVIGMGSGAISGLTYRQAMQEVMDWFAYGQNTNGGWGYYANSGLSDNSTAQWGALPFLYGESWGLSTPASVKTGLELWTNHVQNDIPGDWREGGSGYRDKYGTVNMSKTGGMLLEFAVLDKPFGDGDVQAALKFMNSYWNQPASGWDGNKGNPYAMWAVYKGLQQYGLMETNADGILVGKGMPGANGGVTIGFDGGPQYGSAAGDWYSDYCEWLLANQSDYGATGGYWTGNLSYWGPAMTTGWYINILNATGAPPPVTDPIPEPGTLALVGVGLLGFAWAARRRRRS